MEMFCSEKIRKLNWEQVYKSAALSLDSMTCDNGSGYLSIPTALKMWVGDAEYKDIELTSSVPNSGRFIDTNPYEGSFVNIAECLTQIAEINSYSCYEQTGTSCKPMMFDKGFLRAPVPTIPYVVDTYIDTDKVLDIKLDMPAIVLPNIALPNLSTPDIVVPSITIGDIIVPSQTLDINIPDIPMGTLTIELGEIDIGTITLPDIEIKTVEAVNVKVNRSIDLSGIVKKGNELKASCTPPLVFAENGLYIGDDFSDGLTGNLDEVSRVFNIRHPGAANPELCKPYIESVNSTVVLAVSTSADATEASITDNTLVLPPPSPAIYPTPLPKTLHVLGYNGEKFLWVAVGSCD